MNPANLISKKAKSKGKNYWSVIDPKYVHNAIHTELQDLEVYNLKCEERRKQRSTI